MNKLKRKYQHQQQRVSRKKIIVICVISASCLIICSTIFFNVMNVEHLQASNNDAEMNIDVAAEQTFINEKNIPAPIVVPHVMSRSTTLSAKRAKPLPVSSSPVQ